MGRSWFYPDGYYPAKAKSPQPWDPDANPYPSLVQYKGKVYARTDRWQGGKGAPDVEVDAQGFRTWTLYSSNQLKFRWDRTPVALHTALVKPVDPPKQDTITDPPTYNVGSSNLYFAEQSGDYFSILPGLDDYTPSGIYDQTEDVWNEYRDNTFKADDAFTYIFPSYYSDSPRWTQFHNQDDTVKTTTYTLNNAPGVEPPTYDVTVPDVPGWFVDTYEGGGEFLNTTPGSDAYLITIGYSNYVLGTIGTRPKPVTIPDLQITIPGRILVSSRHFVGREYTGYVVAVRQQYQWIGDATVPGYPAELQGHFDFYPPIIVGFTPEGGAIPQTQIPFTYSQYPITYTIKDEDWIYHPEHRPIEPSDNIVINIPRGIDEGVYVYQGVILTSVTPGASV